MSMHQLDFKRLRRQFAKSAQTYPAGAVINQEIGARLIEHINHLQLSPKRILGIGCGTGNNAFEVTAAFPGAQIIGIDYSLSMLQKAISNHHVHHFINAQGTALPIANQSIDMVFINMTMLWIEDLDTLFEEVKRVLIPGGIFLFATLGSGTLFELKESWQAVDDLPHIHEFLEMQDLGDLLMRHQFSDVVMDMDQIVFHYGELSQLAQDLTNNCLRNNLRHRKKSLTTPRQWKMVSDYYQRFFSRNNQIPATFEVIFGCSHKEKDVQKKLSKVMEGVVEISVDQIGRL
jgi:malonyl-CoA O-methyltransferase